ncbi:rod shape-determining protein MreD [Defluviimonas sp. WL0002]|uniref:Rod shape-determining protein MreD n=1 Tax=Albidovulum marisflavi TaxID=2984159 RepID=A0ABT2ZCI0_9RHOB|nr:rod shape-determining protein MreD [Defluviimonas sp. WL0002]MCV2868811.1 rod shape-determining protein MreD [Defluviimonas sp. WL0002]
MVDPVLSRRLGYPVIYALLCAGFLFLRVLPLSTMPVSVPGPDFVLLLTLLWVIRRPDHVPALLIAGVLLVEDLLTLRAPGLWAGLVIVVTEFLRSHRIGLREVNFVVEWLVASGALLVIALANRAILAMFVVPQAGLGLTLLQVLVSVAAYPVVAFALQATLGLRRTAPGEVDAMGQRL